MANAKGNIRKFISDSVSCGNHADINYKEIALRLQ
jgi:hypothetical protein